MNRNWDIMRNAANGADPYGTTSRMDQTRMRDRDEGFRGAQMYGEAADYGYGAYGYEREPRWARERGYVPSYGEEGFGRESQGWGEYGSGYGGRERGYHGREREHERGMLGRMEQGIDRAFGRDWEHGGEHPSLWERVKGAFTGKGPKNWTRSDDRIREDVCEALTYHPNVDASEIEVSVKDGEVILAGTVSDRGSKRLAEDIADDVRGVRDVHNQIRVQRSTSTTTGTGAQQAMPPAQAFGQRR